VLKVIENRYNIFQRQLQQQQNAMIGRTQVSQTFSSKRRDRGGRGAKGKLLLQQTGSGFITRSEMNEILIGM